MIKNISIGLHGDVAVVVSFEVATEEHLICGVAMKLGINGRDYETFIDDSGAARSHTFVLPVRDQSVTSKSVMYAAISVEDPEGDVHEFYAVRMFALENGYPVVDNAGMMQRADGSGLVDIWYDYFSPYEICPASVTLQLSDDNGKTFDVPTVSAAGDLGDNVPTGTSRHIVWSPAVDLPNVGKTNIVAWVHLVDIRGSTADGFAGNAEINVDKPKTYVVLKQEDEKVQWGIFSGENIKDKTMVADIESSSSLSSLSSKSSQSLSSESSKSSSSVSSKSSSSKSSKSSSSKSSSSMSSPSSKSSSSSSSGSSSSDSSSCGCVCLSPVCSDVSGDDCSHFTNWTFSGMNEGNSDSCKLHVAIQHFDGPGGWIDGIYIWVYKDAMFQNLVAFGSRQPAPLPIGVVIIGMTPSSGSGLLGNVTWDETHKAGTNAVLLVC